MVRLLMTVSEPFPIRFRRNLRRGSAIVGPLLGAQWIVRLFEGHPFVSSLIDISLSYVLLVPAGVLTYTALSRFRTRGPVVHYAVWLATAMGAWLPLLLLMAFRATPLLFPSWSILFLAIVIAALVWGAIAGSIEAQIERSKRAIGYRRSA